MLGKAGHTPKNDMPTRHAQDGQCSDSISFPRWSERERKTERERDSIDSRGSWGSPMFLTRST